MKNFIILVLSVLLICGCSDSKNPCIKSDFIQGVQCGIVLHELSKCKDFKIKKLAESLFYVESYDGTLEDTEWKEFTKASSEELELIFDVLGNENIALNNVKLRNEVKSLIENNNNFQYRTYRSAVNNKYRITNYSYYKIILYSQDVDKIIEWIIVD